MPYELPDADARYPMRLPDGTSYEGMVHLSQVVDHPNIDIGAYTYANDFGPVADYAQRLAPYLYPNAPERLIIGRFCQIASGVTFITASANHKMDGFSTYPFSIFNPSTIYSDFQDQVRETGDTVIGNDVWFGHDAVIMPGVTIGNGAIIGARAVVTQDVPAFTVVAGNPARVVRERFSPDVKEVLLRLAWWNWPDDNIKAAIPALLRGDIEALQNSAP